MRFEESAALGERLLGQALRALDISDIELDSARWDKLVRDSGVKSRSELFADIGLGKRLAAVVARKILGHAPADEHDRRREARAAPVVIRGADGMAVQMAGCCHPIPGDPIIGLISKGQGLVIHTHDCSTLAKSRRRDHHDWVDVEWDAELDRMFAVAIRVIVSNGRGILAKVASAISAADTNITNVHTEDDDAGAYATMEFSVEVADRAHMARLLRSLRRLQEVVRIQRVKH